MQADQLQQLCSHGDENEHKMKPHISNYPSGGLVGIKEGPKLEKKDNTELD